MTRRPLIERLPRSARLPVVVVAVVVVVYVRVTDAGKELVGRLPRWMLVALVLSLGLWSMWAAFRIDEEKRQHMAARGRLLSRVLASRLPLVALRVVLFVLGAAIFGLGLWGLVELA